MAGLPPGASTPPTSGQAASFDESPKLGGFDLSFYLPFSRQELYSELLVADNPLGSSPNVTFEILRAGYSGEISPGCVRRCTFAAPFFGTTTSEMTLAEPGPATGSGKSAIKWRQLESSTRMNLEGRDGIPPEFLVELEGGAEGTLVTMTYNFAKVSMNGPLFCLLNCMPSLLKYHLHSSITSVWHMEMVRRNHVPKKKPVFANLKGDQTEENAIRTQASKQGL